MRLDLRESLHRLLVERHDGYAIHEPLAYVPVFLGMSGPQCPKIQLTDGDDADAGFSAP